MNEKDEEVIGYTYTHWDCPVCLAIMEEEGDAKNEVVLCVTCGNQFTISEVR